MNINGLLYPLAALITILGFIVGITKKGRLFITKLFRRLWRYQPRLPKETLRLINQEDRSWWSITKDMYDKKHQEFRQKQNNIKQKMDSLQTADEEYYLTANYILSLANRAYDLFLSSEPDIKRQLLKLVLQNCEIDNGSLRYTLNYPFSAIFDCVKRSAWLPG